MEERRKKTGRLTGLQVPKKEDWREEEEEGIICLMAQAYTAWRCAGEARALIIITKARES